MERCFIDVVAGVRRADPTASAELYELCRRRLLCSFRHQMPNQEVDDAIHDAFLSVFAAVQRGQVRKPERLMGFIAVIGHRMLAAYIDRTVRVRRRRVGLDVGRCVADRQPSPETRAMRHERGKVLLQVLKDLPAADREILTRFYLDGQTEVEIRAAMNLTATQYRLRKSRAKARFGAAGRAVLLAKKRGRLRRPVLAVA
jgi:RNA polymerase sigma-70 factor, ECF subfamily